MDTIFWTNKLHQSFGQKHPNCPDLKCEQVELYRKLINEEAGELNEALDAGDIVKVLDACIDLQVVLDGFIMSAGLADYRDAAFMEVYRSNLSKLENGKPVFRDDGKVMKGPDYRPPDLEAVMQMVEGSLRIGAMKPKLEEGDGPVSPPFENHSGEKYRPVPDGGIC